jgi:hypothetical protein
MAFCENRQYSEPVFTVLDVLKLAGYPDANKNTYAGIPPYDNAGRDVSQHIERQLTIDGYPDVQNTLSYDGNRELGYTFLESYLFDKTAKGMGILKDSISQSQFAYLQQGQFAFHSLHWFKSGGRHEAFVSYISRFPQTSQWGTLARAEWEGLRLGSELLNKYPHEIQKQLGISIVRPLAFGVLTHRDKWYEVLTTPFIQLGELHVHRSGNNVAYCQYAVEFNRRMGNDNDLIEKFGTNEKYKRQQLAILRAMTSLYVGLGKKFPRSFMLNAGDLMVDLRSGIPTNFTLITTREGLMSLSEDSWLEYLDAWREDSEDGKTIDPISLVRDQAKNVLGEINLIVSS